MPITSKYFVTSTVTGQNWIDFDLNLDGLSITGQEFAFTGSNSVDAVRVGPGVIFDFTKSNGGKDNLFLSGNLADYTLSFATSTVTLERGTGDGAEKIVVAKGTSTNYDNVVFADGTATTFDLHGLASGTLGSLSLTASLAAPTTLNATVKAFALDATGETFAPSAPGLNYIVTGSNAVDRVYISEGATVDTTKLNGGVDEIFFTRNWSDYTKTVFTSKLVFTHAASGESVTVAAASGASNDRLIFADGSVQTNNARLALAANLDAELSSISGFDGTRTTPGLAPKISSSIDNVTNFDVTSSIVLKASQPVTAVEGKFIRIVDDGGAGFRGENTVHTQTISVTDTSKVSINGGVIVVKPGFDLDLAGNYHLEIDEGAFIDAKGKGTAAISDPTALNFSTVTPGAGVVGVSAAAASQAMDETTGSMKASFAWLDIEGVGSPSASTSTTLDLGASNIALVFKDYEAAGGSANASTDGIGAPDLNVRAFNFGAGDLLYVDNQNLAAENLFDQTTVLADTPESGVTQLSFGGSGLGGVVEIDLAGTDAVFAAIVDLRATIGVNYDPVGEAGRAVSPPPDSTTISNLTASNVVSEGQSITYTVTLSGAAPTGGFSVDWFVVPHTPGDQAEAEDFGTGTPDSTYPAGTITIPQGATSGQITIPIFDDALDEGAEVFDLQVGKIGSGSEFVMAFEHWTMIEASDATSVNLVTGTANDDNLNGTAANDSIVGLAGNDWMDGQGGNDTLRGGDGDDYLIGSGAPGNGNDLLDGGDGHDIAGYWFGGQTEPITFTSTWRTLVGQQADPFGAMDTLVSIEELHFGGGSAGDTLVGDTGRNYVVGGGGNDTITGGGGNDTFAYDVGAEFAPPPEGHDTITDFSSNDQIWFGHFGLTSLSATADPASLAAGQVAVVSAANETTLHIGTDSIPGADLMITLLGSFEAGAFAFGTYSQASGVQSEIIYAPGQNNQGDTAVSFVQQWNGPVSIAGDDTLEFMVRFSDAVKISATEPSNDIKLKLVFVDDNGVPHETFASFTPYGDPSGDGSHYQSSMRFEFDLLPSDVGRYHIDSIVVGGGASIISTKDNQPVNLTLDGSNLPITAGNYVYGSLIPGLTGTLGNDALAGYFVDPTTAPTNGVYTGVDGAAGDRDLLAVPVLLPDGVSVADAANYVLKFNKTAMTVSAYAPGSSTAAVTVSVPASNAFPEGVERLVYLVMTKDPDTGEYVDADVDAIFLSKGVSVFTDPVLSTEHFVQGSIDADSLDVAALIGSGYGADTRTGIRGSAGGDTITGGVGREYVYGEGGANQISLGGGDDSVFVGNGNDTVTGGDGRDTIVMTMGSGSAHFVSQGRISGPAAGYETGYWGADGQFVATSTVMQYRFDTTDDGTVLVKDYKNPSTVLMSATEMERLQFRMSDSDERINIAIQTGTTGSDTLDGAGQTGPAWLIGGAGDDTILMGSSGGAAMGGGGNDTLTGGASGDMLYGGAGDDRLTGGGGNDWLVGAQGNDTLDGGENSTSDAAGFYVKSGSVSTSALSVSAYDQILQGFKISQGSDVLATIAWNAAASTWTVSDVSDSVTGGFGVDTVSNVELLVFDPFVSGVSPLTVNMADLAGQLPAGSGPDLTPPASTGATFSVPATPDGTVTVSLNFSEAIQSPMYLPSLFLWNANDGYPQRVFDDASTLDATGKTLTITGSLPYGVNTLIGTDTMIVSFADGQIQDLAGNGMAASEVWFGGSGDNVIDLRYYETYGSTPPNLTLRGNGGNDELLGNGQGNTLIDDPGADTLVGGAGSDTIELTELLTGTVFRDVVVIQPGDSPLGTTSRDQIQPAASNPTTSGFDITSSVAAKHDVLDMPSNLILPDTLGFVDGANVGVFSRHSVAAGVVTLADESGATVAVNGTNSSDAVGYLQANIDGAGLTAALRYDRDSNGSIDSLILFQDGGRLSTQGNTEATETLVVIRDLVGAPSATLGTAPGAHVVEIADVQGPIALNDVRQPDGSGFVIDFNEVVYFDRSTINLQLWKNGVDAAHALNFGLSGSGTQVATISFGDTIGAGDWLFGWYEPNAADSATGVADARGNLERNDNGELSGGGYWAEGTDAAETIDLSAFVNGGVDIDGYGGNDRLIGTAAGDHIFGGAGSDTMTGGAGMDLFGFELGDAPVVNRTMGTGGSTEFMVTDGDSWTFQGGAEVITDLGGGDAIWIDGLSYPGGSVDGGGYVSLFEGGRALVRGSFDDIAGVFTADAVAGADTLLLIDSDQDGGSFDQVTTWTGVILQGITPHDFDPYQSGGGYLKTQEALTVEQALSELNSTLASAGYSQAFSESSLIVDLGLVNPRPGGTNVTLFDVVVESPVTDTTPAPLAGLITVTAAPNFGGVLSIVATSPTFQLGGVTYDMWEFVVDPVPTSPTATTMTIEAYVTGADLADPTLFDANPIADFSGSLPRIATVAVEVAAGATAPSVTLSSLFFTEAMVAPGALIVSEAQSVDFAPPGDNELVYFAEYDAGSNTTTAALQYDTSSTNSYTWLSDKLYYTFEGDVTAQLVPESLVFSG